MENTKFLKAQCSLTGKHFGLEIKQFGGEWKVVNFLEISADEAKVMISEIRQAKFETNSTLLPCDKCRSRVVGGCACKARECQGGRGADFQCIYCKNMKIDYSDATRVSGYKDGDVIRLSQGQEIKIRFNNKPLKRIVVGLGWDPVGATERANMDIDSSVFVMGQRGFDIVYFGKLKHPSGCVVHHGDNLTGVDIGPNVDDENIDVFLDKVPTDRDKLVFVLNIYDCVKRKQNLSKVKNMYIKLYDPVSHTPLVEYRVNANMGGNTALVVGIATRVGSEWVFKAVGRGSNAKSISELAVECDKLY